MTDFTHLVDLAAARLGGRVIVANDEFFAPKENLLKPSSPIFVEGKFTARGKWMDGWETRRRRTPGHDWCIVRLGLPGTVRGVVVDTSFFKGNYPERCWIEACDLGSGPPYKNEKKALLSEETHWVELLPESPLAGDSRNMFPIGRAGRVTHLRLNIFPDGGVARLRVHGEVAPCAARGSRAEFDLAAIENGGKIVASSDQFFGEPLNMIMPGFARNMGEGWETRRRRGPGHDWAIVKLGTPGTIRRIEVSTAHFKGNFPESCAIDACFAGETAADSADALNEWKPLLPKTPLKANARHIFREQLQSVGPATHVRLNIYPDGGISRLRVFGVAGAAPGGASGFERFNKLAVDRARKALLDCCGAKKWVAQMVAKRPFTSESDLFAAADAIWSGLGQRDWLEAFRHHPAIGAGKAVAKQSANARKWSAGEQSVAQQAQAETLAEMAEANFEYQAKFGYVFLICATGKTAAEILTSLRQRTPNDPETELRVAAEEQRKITRLRLEKLLKGLAES